MPPTKKAKTDGTPSRAPNALTSSTIDDLTAVTTAQLYSLSSRRHRDESHENVRRAQEERDRAYVSLEQSQRWLERANEHLERTEENAREAHREYMDAKNLLVRVRQASSAAMEMMGGRVAAGDDSSDEEGGMMNVGRLSSSGKSRKVPFVQDILVEAAKAGELHDGKKLEDIDSSQVARKDRSQFVNSMKLVEELWTEEEELFLRSTTDEINESLEELKVIAETIAVRCLTKLNEWEGRPDPTPTGHQKPSYISVGTRARKIFVSRKRGNVEEHV
mmetsp:Transcript_6713/g.16529  ORF Transcript_6713/g.16529 Transcript_6713/m.16529 type:complete len:276 (-) Transcript_6713:243-1070(-)